MKLSESKINVEAQEQGAWIRDIPNCPGLEVLTRGINNKSYRLRQQALFRSKVPQKDRLAQTVKPETQDEIQAILLAETCLLDWKGLEDGDGQPIPFDPATALTLLQNPENADLRDGCAYAAERVNRLTREEFEALRGN